MKPTKDNDLIGQRLAGRFEVVRLVAVGGMGEIYEAIQHPLGRRVAVKVLSRHRRELKQYRHQFFQEACHSARLSHPNIISIFDYGLHDGEVFFIAMELLEGEALDTFLKRHIRLDPHYTCWILLQILAALHEAHTADLVHRDLKPSNIFLVGRDGQPELVKVLDFGLVKELGIDTQLTGSGFLVGSPMFMSPEQAEQRTIDPRSDQYSLGLIAWYLMTGQTPFNATNALGLLMERIRRPVPSLTHVVGANVISDELSAIIARMTQRNPDDRFKDVQAVIAAILTCPEGNLDASLSSTTISLLTTSPLLPAVEPIQTSQAQDGHRENAFCTTHELPSIAEVTLHERMDLLLLDAVPKGRFKAYVDLSCPFCFVLHERLLRWGVDDRVEWCLVEHASHALEGPFDAGQERILADEVFSVHHRAPDVKLLLPFQRFRSQWAMNMLAVVEQRYPEKSQALRTRCFRALWQDNLDISDSAVLLQFLAEIELDSSLLPQSHERLDVIRQWQSEWEHDDFDRSIPVLLDEERGAHYIGLGTEQRLLEFLLGMSVRTVDSAVCYYQRRPVVLVCGALQFMWPVLEGIRQATDILHASTLTEVSEIIVGIGGPDILLIQYEHLADGDFYAVTELACARHLPWILVAESDDDPRLELNALRQGASEFLTTLATPEASRERLSRILKNYLLVERESKLQRIDSLTGITTRRAFEDGMQSWLEEIHDKAATGLVLFIDIDDFTNYNRRLGYLDGDVAIKRVATALETLVCAHGGTLARFVGDQFVALFKTTPPNPETLAGLIQETIERCRIAFPTGRRGELLSVSIGCLTISMNARRASEPLPFDCRELIEQAAVTMRAAKTLECGFAVASAEPRHDQVGATT